MNRDATSAASPHAGPLRAAVFLDRDGTLIEDRGPLLEPAGLALLPGAALALRRLEEAGYLRILVTNQSAVGRGLLDLAGLDRIHATLVRALAAEGAALDAIYFAPDPPLPPGLEEIATDRRKPGAGMLLEAARDLALDLGRCWMVGDQARDTLAGRRAGCREAILVRTGQGRESAHRSDAWDACCDDLGAAVDRILAAPQSRLRRARRSGQGLDPLA